MWGGDKKQGAIAKGPGGAWVKGGKLANAEEVHLTSQTWHGRVGWAGRGGWSGGQSSGLVSGDSEFEDDSLDSDDDEASSDEEDDLVLQRR